MYYSHNMLYDYLLQAVEIEIDGDYNGIPFVIRSGENWIKNGGSDFYVEFDSGPIKSSQVSPFYFWLTQLFPRGSYSVVS